MNKPRLIISAAILSFVYLSLQGINAMSKPAAELGVHDGRLAECSNKPNCVSSQATDQQHTIAPLKFAGDGNAAWKALRIVVNNCPRTTVVSDEEGYLRCEFRTAIIRFVDDVEFLLDGSNRTIHFRSASRLGYSDMGANRRRMELIRKEFAAAMVNSPEEDSKPEQ